MAFKRAPKVRGNGLAHSDPVVSIGYTSSRGHTKIQAALSLVAIKDLTEDGASECYVVPYIDEDSRALAFVLSGQSDPDSIVVRPARSTALRKSVQALNLKAGRYLASLREVDGNRALVITPASIKAFKSGARS